MDTRKTSEIFCKYFMVGFCKLRDKCTYKHVSEVCKTNDCKKVKCFMRHPKKCKFFFLKNSCKFGSECGFSHESFGNSNADQIEVVRSEIDKIKNENDGIKKENEGLKTELVEMEKKFENICDQVKVLKNEKASLLKENQEFRDINETILADVNDLNEKIRYTIPGHLEDEIAELKENNAILKAILQMNKEYENTFEDENLAEDPINFFDSDEANPTAEKIFPCNRCQFSSTSQRGLNVHIGLKHKETLPKN